MVTSNSERNAEGGLVDVMYTETLFVLCLGCVNCPKLTFYSQLGLRVREMTETTRRRHTERQIACNPGNVCRIVSQM